MSWVTILWSMTAAACLTLAAIHFLIWCQRRTEWANLVFTLTSAGAAVYAGCELAMMLAETPAQFAAALRWLQVPTWVIVVSLAGFVRLHLRAGRRWLAWSIVALRSLALLLNFLVGQNLNYLEVARLRYIPFLGETVSLGVGVSNPFMLVGQLSLLLLVIFTLDATITVWRRGDRRQAVVTGGSIVFFALAGVVQAVLVLWQIVDWPFMESFFYLGIVVAMGYELSRETLRAAHLSDELRESEARMALAAEAAGFGVWMRTLASGHIWASEQWLRLFGFAPGETVNFGRVAQRIHPADRERVERAARRAIDDQAEYTEEYRVILPDGTQRWVAARGRVYPNAAGKPARMLGAAIDVTARRRAEAAMHELGGRLINAQENERRRIARDLHDGLSQSLALISVELEMFGQEPPAQTGAIAGRMQEFSGELKSLASEVHRLAHDLHPAKLDQLGLTAAVRGFCKELAVANELAIEFQPRDVPPALPDDVSLCLYRITQEALQNVVKHSGATAAKVELAANGGELHLVVADDGHGFDLQTVELTASLGIVGMRERVRMVHGQISLQSRPGEGTRVEVRVPLPPQPAAAES